MSTSISQQACFTSARTWFRSGLLGVVSEGEGVFLAVVDVDGEGVQRLLLSDGLE